MGQFALLVSGHFFGSLTLANAILLFLGPVLAWLVELPARFRGLARLLLGILPIVLVLWLALASFHSDSAQQPGRPKSLSVPSDIPEPTLDDYLNFGK